MSEDVRPPRQWRDIVSLVTLAGSIVVAFVVVQTTVSSHSKDIDTLKMADAKYAEKMGDVQDEFSNQVDEVKEDVSKKIDTLKEDVGQKITTQNDKIHDVNIKLITIDGKIDRLIDKMESDKKSQK